MLKPGESVQEKIRQNLFLRAEIRKTTSFTGEPLMVIYKLYSRINTNSQVVKRPSLAGFSILEMVDGYDDKPVVEVYKGIPYYVSILRKAHLVPLQEGQFFLDAAEVESDVYLVRTESDGKLVRIHEKVTLYSEPVKMTILPVPIAGQPADYAGAVGSFQLSVEVPNRPVHTGELVKIRLVISGTGNFSLLTPPKVIWPRGVDTADPVVKESVNRYAYPLKGSKLFEYSFAAPDTGVVIIPAISLAYYDPVAHVYRTTGSKAIPLQVLPASRETYNKSEVQTGNDSDGLPRQLYWFAPVVLLIIGWIIFQSLQMKKNRGEAAVGLANNAAEIKPEVKIVVLTVAADVLLEKAIYALNAGDAVRFYKEIENALLEMASKQLAISHSSLNKENIRQKLTLKGVPAETVQHFISVLETCEWTLYVQSPDNMDPDDALLEKAKAVLTELQMVS